MDKSPSVTFGIIVLNGEPFISYNLRTVYPFARQIIVVEGASPAAASAATPEGHSTDSTLETLKEFKKGHDPENKLTIITAEMEGHPTGFWPGEKDEMSQAYANRAKGSYLWQLDIDEFYHPDDIVKILKMITDRPNISGFSFCWQNFWGGFGYLVDGWEYRDIVKKINGHRRIFRWREGYRYISHRPPTVVDEKGRDLCSLQWIGAQKSARMGIFCYHYGMVFPHQARQKKSYYQNMWNSCKDMASWYRESYLELQHPLKIIHGIMPPSWVYYFHGTHPPEITKLLEDLGQGAMTQEQRATDDIERLLGCKCYRITIIVLSILYYIVLPAKRGWRTAVRLFRFVKKVSRKLLYRFFHTPLEFLPDSPDLFLSYRYLYKHHELTRKPGGWWYKDKFYPDYLTVGGASFAIFRIALKYCRGKGVDIGAGYWPLPGSIPVDTNRGPGNTTSISEISDGSLDYVFSSHCLEHVADWRSVLFQWTRKLCSGGILFLYLPHPDCAIWQPGSPFVGNGHKWSSPPHMLKRALEEGHCDIIDFDDGPDAMYSFYICGRKR